MNSNKRKEQDYLGEVEIPNAKLFGVYSHRDIENLTISPRTVGSNPEFSKAFAHCKWAAALANFDHGVITEEQKGAIAKACAEIVDGQHADSLAVDLLEGSGGPSSNMNFNEVIANRAQQLLDGELGVYDRVHPNDHVNRSQSTNDVYSAAMKMATYALLGPLIDEVTQLADTFKRKASEFDDVLHLGRTCLQDAQPMRLGQVFGGYASLVARLAGALKPVRDGLLVLPLGGTAIGTGFGAPAGYRSTAYRHLVKLTGIDYCAPEDAFDAMQNIDTFSRVSAELRTCATSIAKVASDLILLSSGPAGGIGEIVLPAVQAGSSIMPGKINPVVPMSMVQLSFAVVGNDVCVAQAVQAGQLEINHFEPVVADRVFESIQLLTNGVRLCRDKCVAGIVADRAANLNNLMNSMAVATALVPKRGYHKTSALVRRSVAEGRPLVDTLEESNVLSKTEAIALIEAAVTRLSDATQSPLHHSNHHGYFARYPSHLGAHCPAVVRHVAVGLRALSRPARIHHELDRPHLDQARPGADPRPLRPCGEGPHLLRRNLRVEERDRQLDPAHGRIPQPGRRPRRRDLGVARQKFPYQRPP
ncbi:MAG: aspartate ammonia-lyase, partial [Pseudomonadota bacterium]|nr:aspartate ammonia-lyase [Pseudomonadota bacterium]